MVSLPVNLNPDGVEACIDYLQGEHINLSNYTSSDEIKLAIERMYVTAAYLQISELTKALEAFSRSYGKFTLDLHEMRHFSKSLPAPKFCETFPVSTDELPAITDNQDNH